MIEPDDERSGSLKSLPSFYHFTSRDWPMGDDGGEVSFPVPDPGEFRMMCAGLPEDCIADGLGRIEGGKHCERHTCRICAPTRFRAAVTAAFATAANRGLRYRVTVKPNPSTAPGDQGLALVGVYRQLRRDARCGSGHPFSYVCAFGAGADGGMRLELFTNADFRRSLVSEKDTALALKRLGRTYMKLNREGLVTFREISIDRIREEVLAMVGGVITLLSSGGKPLWAISSSLDIGISERIVKANAAAMADASGAVLTVPVASGDSTADPKGGAQPRAAARQS